MGLADLEAAFPDPGEIRQAKGLVGRIMERADFPTTVEAWQRKQFGPPVLETLALPWAALGETVTTGAEQLGVRRPVSPETPDIGRLVEWATGLPGLVGLLGRVPRLPPPPASPRAPLALSAPARPMPESWPAARPLPTRAPTRPFRAEAPLLIEGPPLGPYRLVDPHERPVPPSMPGPLAERERLRSLYRGGVERRPGELPPRPEPPPAGRPGSAMSPTDPQRAAVQEWLTDQLGDTWALALAHAPRPTAIPPAVRRKLMALGIMPEDAWDVSHALVTTPRAMARLVKAMRPPPRPE